jgi:hypothetical protein
VREEASTCAPVRPSADGGVPFAGHRGKLPSVSHPATERSVLEVLGRFVSNFRWVFMPLGLAALVAVGVHAAADTLDDRLLALADALDAAFDSVVGRFSLTQGLVELVALEERTTFARALALLWELAADCVLVLPALRYREPELGERDPWRSLRTAPTGGWKELWRRMVEQPTPLRWVLPLATAAVVLAGACTAARLVEGSVYLGWRRLLGDGAAHVTAQLLAIGALLGVLGCLGVRAVRRNLEHADACSAAPAGSRRERLTRGLIGCVLVAPLALAALLDASPVLSFFR